MTSCAPTPGLYSPPCNPSRWIPSCLPSTRGSMFPTTRWTPIRVDRATAIAWIIDVELCTQLEGAFSRWFVPGSQDLLEASWKTLHLLSSDQERLESCQTAIASSLSLSFQVQDAQPTHCEGWEQLEHSVSDVVDDHDVVFVQVVGKCEARVLSHATALQSYLQFTNALLQHIASDVRFSWAEGLLKGIDDVIARLM